MKSSVVKRSIRINGQKTSVSLEDEFWNGLHEIARFRNVSPASLLQEIARDRNTCNLSSAIRTFVFNHFRSRDGQQKKPMNGFGATLAQARLDSRGLRARAEEYTALAERSKDPDLRAAMLRISDDYEEMAANAARLEHSTVTELLNSACGSQEPN